MAVKSKGTPVIDLFGNEVVLKRTYKKAEAAALTEVLKALRTHPSVAWVERMNTGAIKIENRFVRFGFKGCPDVIGMLRDGRFIGVETKSQKGRLRPEQALFLELVRSNGGVAFVAKDCRDVYKYLEDS